MKLIMKLVISLIVLLPLSLMASDVKGFVGFQYQWGHGNKDYNGAIAANDMANTFWLSQGAVYFKHSASEKVHLNVDIPVEFSRNLNGNFIDLGGENGQLFMQIKSAENITLYVGRFDSHYGYESNDSPDMVFINYGLNYRITPSTHLGVMASTHHGDLNFKFLIGNSKQAGNQREDMGHEIGLKAMYKLASFDLAVGYLRNKYDAPSADETLLELTVHKPFNSFEVDFTYTDIKSPGGKAADNNSEGILLQAKIPIDKKSAAAVKYEMVTHMNLDFLLDDSGMFNQTRVKQLSVGYDYKWVDNILLKAELLHTEAKLSNAAGKEDWFTGAIAGIYQF